MEQMIQEIVSLFKEGIIPSISAMLLGAASLALSVAKNKIVKKLSDRTNELDSVKAELLDIKSENQNLKDTIAELKEVSANTNKMVSATVDMLHVAYLNSKLDSNSKINLQKLYDKCPDSICDGLDNLINTINEAATEAQLQIVEESTSASYADIIAGKIAQEV